jgi:hypothetical protein
MLSSTRTASSTLHHSICSQSALGGFMLMGRSFNGALIAAILRS